MSYRRLFVLLLLVATPATAKAQFTTFIPPKNKAQDSVKAAVVAQQKAQADSVTAAALTNMKTWVDSAAGIVAPTTHADSVMRADSLATAAAENSTFRDGSRAPSTASPLPFLALIGATCLAMGVGLLRIPPRRDGA